MITEKKSKTIVKPVETDKNMLGCNLRPLPCLFFTIAQREWQRHLSKNFLSSFLTLTFVPFKHNRNRIIYVILQGKTLVLITYDIILTRFMLGC